MGFGQVVAKEMPEVFDKIKAAESTLDTSCSSYLPSLQNILPPRTKHFRMVLGALTENGQCKYLMYCIFSCLVPPRLRQTIKVPGLDL